MKGLFSLILFLLLLSLVVFGFYYSVYFLEIILKKYKEARYGYKRRILESKKETKRLEKLERANTETNRCLIYETNQLEFCTKVIHVLHCEFCQTRLKSIYPDKFKKEEREIIKQQKRV